VVKGFEIFRGIFDKISEDINQCDFNFGGMKFVSI
jgi:hypothetical protein